MSWSKNLGIKKIKSLIFNCNPEVTATPKANHVILFVRYLLKNKTLTYS